MSPAGGIQQKVTNLGLDLILVEVHEVVFRQL